jgi:hypothetical protein
MFILLGVLVVFMVPGEGEPEPEDGVTHCKAMMTPLFENERKNFCETKIKL